MRVALIGCGRIAGATRGGEIPTTHMAAIEATPGLSVCGVFDIHRGQAESFAETWGIATVFDTLEDAIGSRPDLTVIATPAQGRVDILEKVVKAMPGAAIVCEKPLVESDEQLDRVAALLPQAHIWVSYIRHWVPGIRAWAQRAAAGELGEFLGGRAFYTKGLRNNGSHLLALLVGFTPAVRSVRCNGVLQDQRDEDPSVHFTLHYDGGCALSVTALHHAYLGHLSADLCFSTGCLRIDHGGAWIHWARIRPDPMYPGYQSLGDETTLDSGFGQHFVEMYARVAKHLRGEADEPSNLESAIRVSRLVAEILPLGNKGETR